jgi:hypothetical protein
MRPTVRFARFLPLVISTIALGCKSDTFGPMNTPLGVLTVVTIPNNPILSGTKSWVDSTSKRYYLTDVSNAGVDIIDAVANTYTTRVTGFVGATTANNGGTPTTNGAGPNSIVFAPGNLAFVSDGNSQVQVVDLTKSQIVATISTAIVACDGGTATTHYCGRTNEITYDPEDNLVFVQNPSPLSLGGSHTAIDPYATFISAASPYNILGTIAFANAGGQEAPIWVPSMHRLLSAVSGKLSGTPPAVTSPQYVAVINPKTYMMENKYPIDCQALLSITALGINDPALGPNNHFIIPGCGKAIIMDATTGSVVQIMKNIGGGNETWYNSGDGRFYVIGVDSSQTPPVNALGMIDAGTSTFLQGVPAIGATNPAAYASNNEVFAVVQVTAGQVADPTTDKTICATYGKAGTGCVVVFSHLTQ